MYVYLITNGIHYKIGKAKNIDKRLYQLNTGSSHPLSLIKSFYSKKYASKIESALHNMFKYKNTNLEWFDLNIEDIIGFEDCCLLLENNFKILDTEFYG